MPTFLDIAAGSKFDDYVDQIDGQSLLSAISGEPETLSNIAISEFAADGSTGPSRMVKKGPWKYLYLEGVETVLYNLESDPNELKNLCGLPEVKEIEQELHDILLHEWNPEHWRRVIAHSQQQRLKIHNITQGAPTYVHKIRDDDDTRYIRNAGAADTKARARLPWVAPAKPDAEL